jgi:hypothetical protein
MGDQAQVFLRQSELAEGRSPLYARLWREFAHDPRVRAIVGPDPAWDAPLRLSGGLHFLVLTGRATWDDIEDVLVAERDFLREWVAERRVQTNEVQRCWMLLPCFLEAARHTGATAFDLVEIGPSAGLNLVWDRYRYTYVNGGWGDATARLDLRGREERPVPAALFDLRPEICSRTGIDLSPIDVTSEEDALRLRSFVWADQTERVERLDAALAAARADLPELIQGDAADRLPEILDGLSGSRALTVIWETAVLGYFTEESRRRVYETIEEFGARHPAAFVQTRRPSDGVAAHYGLTLRLLPGGERIELAFASHHGEWLDWLGDV